MSDAPAWIEAAVEKTALDACRGLDPDQCEIVCRGCLRYARATIAAFLREVPKGYLIPETEIIGDTIRQHDWLEVAEMPPPKRKERRP